MLMYVSVALIGLAVYLVAKLIFEDEGQFKANEQLEEKKEGAQKQLGIILRFARPFFKRYFSPLVSSMKQKKKFKEKYRQILASAGLTEMMTPEDFFAFKLSLIIGFPLLFLVARYFMQTDWPFMAIPIVSFVGFFYPDIWARGLIQKRQEDIIQNMPFCVDLLALSVEAGLDFVAAMTKVVQKAKPSSLTEEFSILIKELKVGSSRAEALRALAWRANLIQISSFSATLIAADQVGASIGPILKSLALEIRQKRSTELEKKGAQAATKILFPMLLFIMPALFVIIASPFIVEFIR